LSLRIDLSEGRIGPGKIQLLENIHSCGSISGAGRAMKMQHKRAWVLVDEINRACGRAVVKPQGSGKRGGGTALTAFWRVSGGALSKYRTLGDERGPQGIAWIAG
jgi:molybdate transport system regulatory protein